jgi:tRNA-Thr(GGU) m(6)t(6)A37 methyltransferase TsaA
LAATTDYLLKPVGFVSSTIGSRREAPMQGYEGAPDAWIEIEKPIADCVDGLQVGDAVIVITWFHQANRATLKVHPRGNKNAPLAGVFATRSPDRPNPIGLHRVTVKEIAGTRIKVGPLEAIDGTPVVDIKPVLARSADS